VELKRFENDIVRSGLALLKSLISKEVIYGSVAVRSISVLYLKLSFASRKSIALFGDTSF